MCHCFVLDFPSSTNILVHVLYYRMTGLKCDCLIIAVEFLNPFDFLLNIF